jgi:hypothetical protein
MLARILRFGSGLDFTPAGDSDSSRPRCQAPPLPATGRPSAECLRLVSSGPVAQRKARPARARRA